MENISCRLALFHIMYSRVIESPASTKYQSDSISEMSMTEASLIIEAEIGTSTDATRFVSFWAVRVNPTSTIVSGAAVAGTVMVINTFTTSSGLNRIDDDCDQARPTDQPLGSADVSNSTSNTSVASPSLVTPTSKVHV